MGDGLQARFVVGLLHWVHAYEEEARKDFLRFTDVCSDGKLPLLDPDVIRGKMLAIAVAATKGYK
jgi:hypothetical protein